jgi:hypothetical protein
MGLGLQCMRWLSSDIVISDSGIWIYQDHRPLVSNNRCWHDAVARVYRCCGALIPLRYLVVVCSRLSSRSLSSGPVAVSLSVSQRAVISLPMHATTPDTAPLR